MPKARENRKQTDNSTNIHFLVLLIEFPPTKNSYLPYAYPNLPMGALSPEI